VAFSADDEASFRAALKQAIAADRTAVVHVRVDTEARVPSFDSWWDVPIAEVSEEPSVKEALASYHEGKKKQRFYF
jgi:3D-(3,5/4)-trihydroxycyclohexane-1,2-dione acylhydrolase (decyclizing)